MNIIYVSGCCSENKLSELQNRGYYKGIPCAQKYHTLLLQGLSKNTKDNIFAVCALPINRTWTKKLFFKSSQEKTENLSYYYSGFINYPILRQLCLYYFTARKIKKIIKHNKDCIIVCDILNQSVSAAARNMGKKFGVCVVGIVTDVPGVCAEDLINQNRKNKKGLNAFFTNSNKESMLKYDAYLLLTEAMNGIVNPNKQPHIVIEGHSDSRMADKNNEFDKKSSPKVMMYAGSLRKIYGLELLVNAFKRVNPDGWELHFYGSGDYASELQQICLEFPKIKFFGVVPNEEIVNKQLLASLTVNPRPTNEEYVKYSFPSKTLEAMVSGTPLLTTRLPGMPEEYNDFVYLFGEETETAFAETLEKIFAVSAEELHKKGCSAKEFSLEQKNNVVQAKKLYDFLKDLKQ